jgi:hypothetical protein
LQKSVMQLQMMKYSNAPDEPEEEAPAPVAEAAA